MLIVSCRSKGIAPNADSMNGDTVVRMAREDYTDLQADVDGDLPSFEDAMAQVKAFYGSLPWDARVLAQDSASSMFRYRLAYALRKSSSGNAQSPFARCRLRTPARSM